MRVRSGGAERAAAAHERLGPSMMRVRLRPATMRHQPRTRRRPRTRGERHLRAAVIRVRPPRFGSHWPRSARCTVEKCGHEAYVNRNSEVREPLALPSRGPIQ